MKKVIIERAIKKPKLIIYGPTGVGKTTFASKNDKKIFITTEEKGNENNNPTSS